MMGFFLRHYRKRFRDSYILREVRSVREREREREREIQRDTERERERERERETEVTSPLGRVRSIVNYDLSYFRVYL